MNSHSSNLIFKSHVSLYVICAALLTLMGCASMSKEECAVANWHTVGFEDGSAGRALNYIGRHRKACAKAGVAPEMGEYEQGHAKGLDYYCVFDTGFRLGSSGSGYNAVCLATERQRFAQGYDTGRAQYLALQDVRASEQTLNAINQEIQDTLTLITEAEAIIVSSESTEQQRRDELVHIEQLRLDIPRLERDYRREEKVLQQRNDYYQSLLQP